MKEKIKNHYSAPEITFVAVFDNIQCLCTSNGSKIDPIIYDDDSIQWE